MLWCVVLVVGGGSAEKWRWPEGAESVRIDTKIGFYDTEHSSKQKKQDNIQNDEVPFQEPSNTEGFYNRPPGAGRYPVLVDGHSNYNLKNDQTSQYHSALHDGTLDSLQFCKCVVEPDCKPKPNSQEACGAGRYLCCYRRPNKAHQQNSEFFNEVEDERPMLLPGRENLARPFPPPPGSVLNGYFGNFGPGHGHDNSVIGAFDKQPQGILVGPNGPTGSIGPQSQPDVLVGPAGPTGIIGPSPAADDARRSESAQRGVLVGPGGPTGIIGPAYGRRPVLVGPGGPTGIIGPTRSGRNPGILVGPGGPTGIIGPAYGRQPGILTGPEGPTGIIGPGRGILTGPGGPTGRIGPPRYFSV